MGAKRVKAVLYKIFMNEPARWENCQLQRLSLSLSLSLSRIIWKYLRAKLFFNMIWQQVRQGFSVCGIFLEKAALLALLLLQIDMKIFTFMK